VGELALAVVEVADLESAAIRYRQVRPVAAVIVIAEGEADPAALRLGQRGHEP
jgi:hypothetical protein